MKLQDDILAVRSRAEQALGSDPDLSYEVSTGESSSDYWAGVEDALNWVLGIDDPPAFRD